MASMISEASIIFIVWKQFHFNLFVVCCQFGQRPASATAAPSSLQLGQRGQLGQRQQWRPKLNDFFN